MCRGSRQAVGERGHRCNLTTGFVGLLIQSSEFCSTARLLQEVSREDPFLWYPLWVGWISLNLRLRSLCRQCTCLCVNQVSGLPFWGLEGMRQLIIQHLRGDWIDATLSPTVQTFIDSTGKLLRKSLLRSDLQWVSVEPSQANEPRCLLAAPELPQPPHRSASTCRHLNLGVLICMLSLTFTLGKWICFQTTW